MNETPACFFLLSETAKGYGLFAHCARKKRVVILAYERPVQLPFSHSCFFRAGAFFALAPFSHLHPFASAPFFLLVLHVTLKPMGQAWVPNCSQTCVTGFIAAVGSGIFLGGVWLAYAAVYYHVTGNSRVHGMGAAVAGLLIVAVATVWDCMYLRDVAQTQVRQLLEQRVVAHAHRGHVEAVRAYLRAAGLGSAESATGPLARTLAGTLAQVLRPADRFARLEILAVSALHLWLRLRPYFLLGLALQAACRNDHAHLVQVLLAEGVPYTRLHHLYASRVVCMQTRGKWPLLCCAARTGSLAVIRVLLRSGASVHERTHISLRGPGSAVSVALWHGHWRAAAMLLDAKASVTWDPPLALACMFPEAGENGILERLLHCKVDVDAMITYGDTDTPLATAVTTASVSMVTVRLLLQAKASVNAAVRFPPLMRAVARGHREVVRCLCEAKADVNFGNYDPFVTLTTHSWPRLMHDAWPRHKQFFLPALLFLTDYAEDSVMRDFHHQACMRVLGLPADAVGSLDGEHGRNRRACIRVLLHAKATLPLHRSMLTHSGIAEMMDAGEHVAFCAV